MISGGWNVNKGGKSFSEDSIGGSLERIRLFRIAKVQQLSSWICRQRKALNHSFVRRESFSQPPPKRLSVMLMGKRKFGLVVAT